MKRTNSYLNKDYDINFNTGILILGMIITIFIAPWFIFWIAYFGGWIAKITIGKQLIAGLAMLNIDLPLNKIPLLAATLGWIGGFFKTINTVHNN